MARNGKLTKKDIEALQNAWGILSRWSEQLENKGMEETAAYSDAMTAVCGLCNLLNFSLDDDGTPAC